AVEQRARTFERGRADGQEALVAEERQRLELHVVDERAARQWIEHLERHRLLTRRQAVDRLQEEAVRTDGEVLERGGREGARTRLVAGEGGARQRVRIDEAVRRRPALEPAPAARTQRACEVRVGGQKIGRGAGGGVRV